MGIEKHAWESLENSGNQGTILYVEMAAAKHPTRWPLVSDSGNGSGGGGSHDGSKSDTDTNTDADTDTGSDKTAWGSFV